MRERERERERELNLWEFSSGSTMAGRGHVRRRMMHEEMLDFNDAPQPPLQRMRRLMASPHHPLEEELAIRHDEFRRLHADNRLLLEENVAMRRDITAAREELHALRQAIPKIRADKEAEAREMIERGRKLETELHAMEPIKEEVLGLRSEAQKLDAICQEMSAKIQSMTQDLKRLQAENQKIPALRMEIDGLHQELTRASMAYEHEKKANAELMEQSQFMEKNIVMMAQDIEKLKAERLSMETRARGSDVGAYGGESGYLGPYGDTYGGQKGLYGASSWSSYEPRGPPRR